MSIDQPLDPAEIEKTKQQIRTLVNEIAQLTKADIAPQEFYSEFLPRVVYALAAVGGVVWTLDGQGHMSLGYYWTIGQEERLRLGYRKHLLEVLRESEENQAQHSRLLQKVIASGEGMLVGPNSGFGEDSEGFNPSDFLLVLAPVRTELETVAIVEVSQRSDAGLQTQKGYLRFLIQMCDLAGDYFRSRQLREFGDRGALWAQLEEFTRSIHASLDPRQTAFTIANEGRRLIECDRVSVAIRHGNRCTIEAVSGQDVVDKRSNTVRLLGKLATAVVAGGEPVWYTGDTSNMAPQIEDAMQEYVDESHSKTVGVLPLARPAIAEPDETDPDKREPAPAPVGALIVEQIEDVRLAPKVLQRVEVVARHSATALANATEYNDLFLMPLWRTLGKAKWVLSARTLPKTVLVAAGLILVIAGLVLIPAPFKLHCKGTLEPVQRRDVFAGIQGVVDQVLVDDGDTVKSGQLLAKLRNTELKIRLAEITGQLQTNQEEMTTIQRELLEARLVSIEERNRLAGRLAELKQEAVSLQARKELLERQQQELEVRSPVNGQVVTWDLYNRLISRPVERGMVLMRVADTDGPWELELRMPEDRMGFIAQARQALRQRDPNADLPVEFVLATQPGVTHVGRVREIHLAAEIHGDEGNTVLIKVAMDRSALRPEQLRPGATVKAKVDCGWRALGFVWFHDLIAWIQYLWFWWW